MKMANLFLIVVELKFILPHKHLAEQLKYLRDKTGFDSFDGELYVHGMPLQKIVSLVKKVQPDSAKLEYRIYDIPSDKVWEERVKDLTKLVGTSYTYYSYLQKFAMMNNKPKDLFINIWNKVTKG